MRPLFILLACFALIGSLFADDWTIDGNAVYWESNGYTIRAEPATSHDYMLHTQYVNFSSVNPAEIKVNLSFVFQQMPSSGSISILQNRPHTVPVTHYFRQEYETELYGVSYYIATNETCDFGDAQNVFRMNVTHSSGNTIACFDSYVNYGNDYTLTYTLDSSYVTEETQYWNEWVDILSMFEYSQIGDYHVWTVNDVDFNGNTNYVTRFQYTTQRQTDGKFDIYAHAGSPADVVNGISPIYVALDPWWNSSYTKRIPVNCSNMNASDPVLLNGTSGFSINGIRQNVWSTCSLSNMSIYYNTESDYVIADDSGRLPTIVQNGTGLSYNPQSVFAGYNATILMNETSGTTAFDVQGLDDFTNTNALVAVPGIIGNSYYFASISSSKLYNAGGMGFNASNSSTRMIWMKLNTTSGAGKAVFEATAEDAKTCQYLKTGTTGLYAERTRPGTATYKTAEMAIPENAWLFAVVRYNASAGNLTLLVNASEVASITSPASERTNRFSYSLP